MSVYLEVDGAPVPVADCSWLLVAPCGCVCGLTVADPRVDGPVVTAEQAMSHFVGNKVQRARDVADGWTCRVLGPPRKASTDLLRLDCPHTPKYGREPLPTLPGYTWAEDGRRGPRSHLVLDSLLDTYANSTALCGSASWGWRKADSFRDLPSCRRCEAQARTRSGGAS